MLAKAPVLACFLTALACFLVGALAAEGWSQAYAPPVMPTAAVVATLEADSTPTALPVPTQTPTPVPTLEAWTARDRPPTPDRPWQGLP